MIHSENLLVGSLMAGSSFICDACHEVVNVDRATAHLTKWCSALPDNGIDDDDDD
jgi:hypothetical protein